MTTFYDEMAALARDLLAEFGNPDGFACRRQVGSKFDKVTGGHSGGQIEEQTLIGVRVPVNQTLPNQFDIQFEGQTLKVGEVIMLKVAAVGLDFVPEIGHSVVIDSKEMPIVSCTPVNPAGTPLLYNIALKK